MDAVWLTTSELACAELLAESGVELIQYRNKQSSSRSLFEMARTLADFLRPRNVRFIVNDRPDVAALVHAAGVHVGQQDLSVEQARAICPLPAWVGVSTHNLDQVRAAAATTADYIAIGPIFPTATKAHPDPVVGIDFIRQARTLTSKPLVAIGGITAENAAHVYRAGANSVAVARDLLTALHPAERAREFLDLAHALSASAPFSAETA
jgi:thiamine-phosphate pyrophosphorylase